LRLHLEIQRTDLPFVGGVPAQADEVADAFQHRPEVLQRLPGKAADAAARLDARQHLGIEAQAEFKLITALAQQQRLGAGMRDLHLEGIHRSERRQAVEVLQPLLELGGHAAHGKRVLVLPWAGWMPSFCSSSAARGERVFTHTSYRRSTSRSSKTRASCEMSASASTNCRNLSASSA